MNANVTKTKTKIKALIRTEKRTKSASANEIVIAIANVRRIKTAVIKTVIANVTETESVTASVIGGIDLVTIRINPRSRGTTNLEIEMVTVIDESREWRTYSLTTFLLIHSSKSS